jgi:hypothetical protein
MRTLLFLIGTSIAFSQTTPTPLSPITSAQRLQWAAYSSVGPPSIAAGALTSAYSTATNSPREYGPHWDGYGKRIGLRITGAATSTFMEASIGSLWGEDPRYRRAAVTGAKNRIWYAVKTAFVAYDRNGKAMPAYARFIAIPSSNVISNAWRPDSQRTVGDTTARVGLGFLSRIAANTFAEFMPDIKKKFRRK